MFADQNFNNNFNLIFNISENPNVHQNNHPNSNEDSSTKFPHTKNNFNNFEPSIKFIINFTTGQRFTFKDNPYNLFESTLDKFLKENRLESYKNKIRWVLCGTNPVDYKKSLLDNNIKNNSQVLCFIDTNSNYNKTSENNVPSGFRFYAQISKPGRDQNGNHKENQDVPLIHFNIGNIKGFNLFGVLDGHGPHGHFVSQFCKNYFVTKMTDYANKCKLENYSTPDLIYDKLKSTNFQFIKDCFINVDLDMTNQNKFEYKFSGTTCNLIIQLKRHLICANVGNSRSIIIYDDGSNTNQKISVLSKDHTPDLPLEYQRIINSGGIIGKFKDKNGKIDNRLRVFKSGHTYPGLTLSRSLGDFVAKECGVISEPVITICRINHNTKYLVICSDGIFKYLKSEDIRDFGNIYYQRNEIGRFCTNLVIKAIHKWESNGIIRDDITVVCVYF